MWYLCVHMEGTGQFLCCSQECCLLPSSLSLVHGLSIRPDRTASKAHGVTSLPVLCRGDTRLLSVSHLRQGLWGSGCPETHYLDQVSLELEDPPDSASQVSLKARTATLPSRILTFLIYLPFFSEGRYWKIQSHSFTYLRSVYPDKHKFLTNPAPLAASWDSSRVFMGSMHSIHYELSRATITSH